MLVAKDEFAFKNVDEFRTFMGVKGNACAGLESNKLHLQTISHGDIFDEYSVGENRRLPRQIIASYT
jgi:hypothetical protein